MQRHQMTVSWEQEHFIQFPKLHKTLSSNRICIYVTLYTKTCHIGNQQYNGSFKLTLHSNCLKITLTVSCLLIDHQLFLSFSVAVIAMCREGKKDNCTLCWTCVWQVLTDSWFFIIVIIIIIYLLKVIFLISIERPQTRTSPRFFGHFESAKRKLNFVMQALFYLRNIALKTQMYGDTYCIQQFIGGLGLGVACIHISASTLQESYAGHVTRHHPRVRHFFSS